MSPELSATKMSAKTDLTPTLTCPKDWEDWHKDFKIQAQTSDLWSHIDPTTDGEPLLEKPKRPQFSDYKKHQNTVSQHAPVQSTVTAGSQDAETTTGDAPTSSTAGTDTPARTISDLSPQDRDDI